MLRPLCLHPRPKTGADIGVTNHVSNRVASFDFLLTHLRVYLFRGVLGCFVLDNNRVKNVDSLAPYPIPQMSVTHRRLATLC